MAQTKEEYYDKFGGGRVPLMSGKEYRAKFESGELLVETHYDVLRISFFYLQDYPCVFPTAKKLHEHGWSFSRGNLKFNCTLDIFYLSQLMSAYERTSNELNDVFYFPGFDDFDYFYVEHRQLLDEDAWKLYYSPGLLMESSRYYRLPDLQHLPESDSPIGMPRNKGGAAGPHATKLPRWATEVCCVIASQPTVPIETMKQLALSTLKQTISRLRKDFPDVQPYYSETQALFWLRCKLYTTTEEMRRETKVTEYWGNHGFGMGVATGLYDPWEWEAHYSPERWVAAAAEPDVPFFEPDLDGTRPPEVQWAGWPNGSLDEEACDKGWDPELGSEEVVAFLAAVAVKETDGVGATDMSQLDFSVRSHMLLAVMNLASKGEKEAESHLQDLKRRLVEAGRFEEARAEPWIRNALLVMKPYLQNAPAAYTENQNELFGRILTENGQLFGRWRVSSNSKFDFSLKRRVTAEKTAT